MAKVAPEMVQASMKSVEFSPEPSQPFSSKTLAATVGCTNVDAISITIDADHEVGKF